MRPAFENPTMKSSSLCKTLCLWQSKLFVHLLFDFVARSFARSRKNCHIVHCHDFFWAIFVAMASKPTFLKGRFPRWWCFGSRGTTSSRSTSFAKRPPIRAIEPSFGVIKPYQVNFFHEIFDISLTPFLDIHA